MVGKQTKNGKKLKGDRYERKGFFSIEGDYPRNACKPARVYQGERKHLV
jgi:hypothetical protein